MRRPRTRTSSLARLVLSAALLWAPVGASALGLGKLTLHSGLDEPLSAEIELTAVTSGELKTLRSGLAPRAEFEAAGVEWASHLTGIKYTVSARADGTPVLHLSSDQPIREPFLHFLLQVEWTGGRLIREYTALLDPPYLAASKPVGVEPPAAPAVEDPIAQELAAAETTPAAGPGSASAVAAEQGAADLTKTAASSGGQAGVVPIPGGDEDKAEADVAQEADDEETQVAEESIDASEEGTESPASANLTKTDAVDAKASPSTESARSNRRAESEWATSTAYGPVKKGDTLWKIAERLRADKSISLEQTMLALLKANRQAFIGNNVNHLKTGKILKTPDRAAVESVSRRQALKEFRAQYDAWQEYKLKLASTGRTIKVAADKDAGAAKGAIEQAATGQDSKPAAGAGASDSTDLLKIVRANLNEAKGAQTGKPTGAGAEQAALAERVAMLEEALESKELENKELRERLTHLETQIKNAQRLIEIESARLAQAQQQAASQAQQQVATPAQKTVAGAVSTDATTPPPAATDASAKPAVTPAAPAPAAAVTPAPAAKPPAPAVKKPAAPAPVVEPDEPGLLDQMQKLADGMQKPIDELVNNPLFIPGVGGLGIIIAGTLFLYYRRRRRSIAAFEESILSGGGLNSEGTPSNPNGGGDVSLLSDFSQGGMGNMHTDEVDPIAEAEVYLAYGRDEQAEEILREAIVKDPQRLELRQKLAEIYHHRNDLGAFETLAEELYAALAGKGGKVWDRVAELGRKMNPANPMFRSGAAAGMTAPAAGAMAAASMFGGASQAASAPVSPDEVQFASEPMSPASAGLDFNLDPATPEASPATTDFSFDLDLGGNVASGVEPAENSGMDSYPEPAASGDMDLGGLDMDFGSLSLESSSGEGIDFEAATSSSSDLGISFDTDAAEPGGGSGSGLGDVEWNVDDTALESMTLEGAAAEGGDAGFDDGLVSSDEIATKLDLAKAYIDMGDGDGARSILDEVLAEGNDAQKRQAADLAAQIA